MAQKEIPWYRMMAASLVVMIPITAICLTDTVMSRMPNTYSYNLQSTEVLYDLTTPIDETKLVNMICDYMQMKTDVFQLKEDIEYEPADIFSPLDQELMSNIRLFENIFGLVAFFGLIWIIAVYIILIRNKGREMVMDSYRKSRKSFLVLAGILLLIRAIPPLQESFSALFAGKALPNGDMLVQIFGDSLLRQFGIMAFIISAILMILAGMVTNEVAGQRKLFKKY